MEAKSVHGGDGELGIPLEEVCEVPAGGPGVAVAGGVPAYQGELQGAKTGQLGVEGDYVIVY